MAFVRFCFIVPLLYPVAVVLSVSIGVGGCLCPNSSNVVLRTAPSLAFIKTAPISASAAEDITFLRTLLMIKIAPFVSFLSVFVSLPMQNNPLPCFWLHFLKDKRHHCGCVISCQMHGTLFLFLDACCNNSEVP
jgi:hypothetical protein